METRPLRPEQIRAALKSTMQHYLNVLKERKVTEEERAAQVAAKEAKHNKPKERSNTPKEASSPQPTPIPTYLSHKKSDSFNALRKTSAKPSVSNITSTSVSDAPTQSAAQTTPSETSASLAPTRSASNPVVNRLDNISKKLQDTEENHINITRHKKEFEIAVSALEQIHANKKTQFIRDAKAASALMFLHFPDEKFQIYLESFNAIVKENYLILENSDAELALRRTLGRTLALVVKMGSDNLELGKSLLEEFYNIYNSRETLRVTRTEYETPLGKTVYDERYENLYRQILKLNSNAIKNIISNKTISNETKQQIVFLALSNISLLEAPADNIEEMRKTHLELNLGDVNVVNLLDIKHLIAIIKQNPDNISKEVLFKIYQEKMINNPKQYFSDEDIALRLELTKLISYAHNAKDDSPTNAKILQHLRQNIKNADSKHSYNNPKLIALYLLLSAKSLWVLTDRENADKKSLETLFKNLHEEYIKNDQPADFTVIQMLLELARARNRSKNSKAEVLKLINFAVDGYPKNTIILISDKFGDIGSIEHNKTLYPIDTIDNISEATTLLIKTTAQATGEKSKSELDNDQKAHHLALDKYMNAIKRLPVVNDLNSEENAVLFKHLINYLHLLTLSMSCFASESMKHTDKKHTRKHYLQRLANQHIEPYVTIQPDEKAKSFTLDRLITVMTFVARTQNIFRKEGGGSNATILTDKLVEICRLLGLNLIRHVEISHLISGFKYRERDMVHVPLMATEENAPQRPEAAPLSHHMVVSDQVDKTIENPKNTKEIHDAGLAHYKHVIKLMPPSDEKNKHLSVYFYLLAKSLEKFASESMKQGGVKSKTRKIYLGLLAGKIHPQGKDGYSTNEFLQVLSLVAYVHNIFRTEGGTAKLGGLFGHSENASRLKKELKEMIAHMNGLMVKAEDGSQHILQITIDGITVKVPENISLVNPVVGTTPPLPIEPERQDVIQTVGQQEGTNSSLDKLIADIKGLKNKRLDFVTTFRTALTEYESQEPVKTILNELLNKGSQSDDAVVNFNQLKPKTFEDTIKALNSAGSKLNNTQIDNAIKVVEALSETWTRIKGSLKKVAKTPSAQAADSAQSTAPNSTLFSSTSSSTSGSLVQGATKASTKPRKQ